MYLERLLQINMVTLAALGTLLLGMGQRSVLLPMLVIASGAVSLWLTDIKGWLRLSRAVTNVAAVVALVLTLWELAQFRGILQVLYVANLLVYLQIILFFQQKSIGTYRQLFSLSLLQVVSATALNQGLWFGLLLLVYLGVALSAMALLLLHQEVSRYRPAAEPPEARQPRERRWPLGGVEPAFCGATSGGSGRAGLGREFWTRLGRIAGGTLLLTLVLFFTVPRLGANAWRGAVVSPRQTVGFNDRVHLGELGLIIESPEEVMRIQFAHRDTEQPFQVSGDVYLRGAILTHYRDKRWSQYGPPAQRRYERLRMAAPPRGQDVVLQKITVEPLDREELFCVWPFFSTQPDQGLLLDVSRERLLRPSQWTGTRFSFELATTAFEQEMLAPLVPAQEDVAEQYLLDAPSSEGPGSLPELVALADRWVAQSPLALTDRYQIALYLARQLRDSGQFTYSLKRPPRDPRLDPLDDFVSRHRQGHCEYFASALTLMLRTQGIPSRMVVGYRATGEDYNKLGKFYQVRQLHAHTWVEAYLAPQYLPPEVTDVAPPGKFARGAWLRLDPTPSGPGGDPLAAYPFLSQFGKMLDWADFLWANYIMEMDRPRQKEAVYDPVVAWLRQTGEHLSDPHWWRQRLRGLLEMLDVRTWGAGAWLGWRGLTVAALVMLAAYGMYLARRRHVWRRLVKPLVAMVQEPADGQRIGIEFYRRLEHVLARRGMRRGRGQTQREFASAAGRRLAELTGQQQLAGLPCEVAEAFYRVRFGHAPLDSRQAETVEQALGRLEQAL